MLTDVNVYLVAYLHRSKEKGERGRVFSWSQNVAAKDVPSALAKALKRAKALEQTSVVFTDCTLKASDVLL